ncbi:MAG: DUF192 domain-containing protein [Hyphomicrobiaceae bacterium]|nr:DUF192 domain-containing protein [Hyphomicrobiaceae bacterium]
MTIVTETGAHRITIEIADTDERKRSGLMFRTSLAPSHGMLFPYKRPQELTMWMRNTYISLDMIFIRADGVVHRVEADTEPLSESLISSHGDVTAVLELAAGEARRLAIGPGSRVEHPFFVTPGLGQPDAVPAR